MMGYARAPFVQWKVQFNWLKSPQESLNPSCWPDAGFQVLPLCGLGIVLAALCLEFVSRTSNQRSASNSAARTRGVSAYACPSDTPRAAACWPSARTIHGEG